MLNRSKLFVISFIAFLLSSCHQPMGTNLITGKEGKPLPSFNLLLPDSLTIYSTNQMKGKPTVFFFFGPDCPYCQQQMEEIKANMIELENIQFVILTGEGFSGMKNFVERNGLKEYPNVIAGLDTANFFTKYYKLNGYPFTAFYNKEGVLQYVYNGEIKMEKFISMTQKLD